MAKTKTDTPQDIRALRAAHAGLPGGAGRVAAFPTQLRGTVTTLNGKQFYEVDGYATVFNKAYTMWDGFGKFKETADSHMLDRSMAANPDVAFLVNHKGTTMARTKNGSLDLSKDDFGLKIHALLNFDRTDVRDLASAVNDGLIDEMSFAFMLVDGEWDESYENFRITEADINRGDVSAVNFGANPYTSIGARAQEFFRSLEDLPLALRAEAVSNILTADDAGSVMHAAVNLARSSGDRYKKAALRMSGFGDGEIEDLDADSLASKNRLAAMVASDEGIPAGKQPDGKTEDKAARSAADTVTLYANRWEMLADESV